jgi:hypothetical protein
LVYNLLKYYKPDILVITRTWWDDKKRIWILWYI